MMRFAEVAGRLDLPYCRGIDPSGHYCDRDHKRGEFYDGKVHWADRTPSHAGIRRFLLVAAAIDPRVAAATGWQRIYLANRWEVTASQQLGLRIPKSLSVFDRATVKVAVADLPKDTPLRKEALLWSQR